MEPGNVASKFKAAIVASDDLRAVAVALKLMLGVLDLDNMRIVRYPE
jgi:hypothetical protein